MPAEPLSLDCRGKAVREAGAEIVGRIPVGDGPSHLPLFRGGSRVYSANSWEGTLSRVTADGEHVGSEFSGHWVYIAKFFDDTLSVFEAGTLERVAVLAIDAYPHGTDISPDARHVIATGSASNPVRVYDCESHIELARIEVGHGSSHSAFTPECGTAFVGCSVSDHAACIDLAELRRANPLKIANAEGFLACLATGGADARRSGRDGHLQACSRNACIRKTGNRRRFLVRCIHSRKISAFPAER